MSRMDTGIQNAKKHFDHGLNASSIGFMSSGSTE